MSGLGRKTILGFVQLLVIFGAGIFLPAWTFNYWQAWLFIGVFMTCGVLITVYLWKKDPKLLGRRMSAGPTAEKEKVQKLIMLLGYVGFMALIVIPALDHRWSWSHVPSAVVVLGDILIIIGCYMVLLVFRENSFTSATIEIADDQKVISTGPYSIVRHPMYAGGFFRLIGTPLALGSYWGLLPILAMMPILMWRLLDEERFLAKNLPVHIEYQKKVRYHLIPFIW